MKPIPFRLFIYLVCVLTLGACAAQNASPPPPPEVFSPTDEQGGQIPADIVQEASRMHSGSMTGAATPENGATGPGPGRLSVVLGPINAEQLEEVETGTSDAGQTIRETISQALTMGNSITLFDAPEERFINDSPRPDLARKGVGFVIKGVVSSSTVSKEITVFLRAVDTSSGKVAMVASARHESRNRAAADATERLLQKLKGPQP
jgi:hypothetical protein